MKELVTTAWNTLAFLETTLEHDLKPGITYGSLLPLDVQALYRTVTADLAILLSNERRPASCPVDTEQAIARLHSLTRDNHHASQLPVSNDALLTWLVMTADVALMEVLVRISPWFRDSDPDPDNTQRNDQELIQILDTALITSGGVGKRREPILQLISALQKYIPQQGTSHNPRNHDVVGPVPQIHLLHPVSSWSQPSVLAFTEYIHHSANLNHRPQLHYATTQPRVITNALDHWPSLSHRPWSNIGYLRSVVGHGRMVPVEFGSQYIDPQWKQRLIPFTEFVDHILFPDSSSTHPSNNETTPTPMYDKPVAYLAQHDLFQQIPALQADISIPDYCYGLISETEDTPLEPLIHWWLGPRGTVSPLHYDRYHNLLVQVVGYKYVRLYSPLESAKLYPFTDDSNLSNTSRVDVRRSDVGQFPAFAQASYVECLLKPGEMLYIPPYWWHYVESLSVSCSLSFWF
ncbi:hypothetical protein IWQ62_002400 [Dispira parvispora]|uniref:JmjC domain-containing protein n=1 Tax=Dispira parvispora TaxID=1520584 RepID=A0A9W8AQG2_9FUNG|nr:hypothetical protein IWQ62_002400 [Dispira parvispora]